MTHWGHHVKSLQQMLPFAFRSRPWLARTLNFADVIAMALGPASKYIIRYMPGPCVGRLTSISCCSTDPVAVLFVNGCYFQILVAMFNIGALRCSRNCPRSTTPRTRLHVSAPRHFVPRCIIDGICFFVCCSKLLGSCSSGNSTGICFQVHGHVSRISADHCYASRCSCHQLIERMRCFRISARLPPAMATCMLHHLLHVSHCAKFLTLLTGFPHRQEFVASEHAYCT